jgi:hypothetical protein
MGREQMAPSPTLERIDPSFPGKPSRPPGSACLSLGKAVAAEPEYTLVINDQKTAPPIDEAKVSLKPPSGPQKIGLESFAEFDEPAKPSPLKEDRK